MSLDRLLNYNNYSLQFIDLCDKIKRISTDNISVDLPLRISVQNSPQCNDVTDLNVVRKIVFFIHLGT